MWHSAGAATVVRRALDILIALLALALTAPLLLLAVIAIRLETPGRALFRQVRVGRGGRHFKLYKLRGMYADAQARWPQLYEYRYRPDELRALRFHQAGDPRVTRVGRVIRRTSIDELPNFINVLKGDMSVVGPRPEIPELLPYYGECAQEILSVKPGVTSLAKVTGRDGLDFEQSLAVELDYLRRRNLLLDLKVIWATLRTVVLLRGAEPG